MNELGVSKVRQWVGHSNGERKEVFQNSLFSFMYWSVYFFFWGGLDGEVVLMPAVRQLKYFLVYH